MIPRRTPEVIQHPDFLPNPVATFLGELAQVFALGVRVEKTELRVELIELVLCGVQFCQRIGGKGPIPSETPIHAAVYRHRPDVESVLHCHARYSILVGLLDSGLIPFNREARIFADGVPIFPESHGINSFGLAKRMVDALGPHYAIFLRGHGTVVVGPGIEGTCISAIQLERACQDQLLMMSITSVKPMAGAGRSRVNARLENPYRAWPFLLYKHKVKSKAQIRAGIRTLKEGQHY